MRYVLRLEAIGDNHDAAIRHYCRLYEQVTGIREQIPSRAPWVARITGFSIKYLFEREFVKGERDYSEANSIGSRGIWIYYFLRPGLYEISQPVSWKDTKRYFAEVLDSENIIELTKDEVYECLQRKLLA